MLWRYSEIWNDGLLPLESWSAKRKSQIHKQNQMFSFFLCSNLSEGIFQTFAETSQSSPPPSSAGMWRNVLFSCRDPKTFYRTEEPSVHLHHCVLLELQSSETFKANSAANHQVSSPEGICPSLCEWKSAFLRHYSFHFWDKLGSHLLLSSYRFSWIWRQRPSASSSFGRMRIHALFLWISYFKLRLFPKTACFDISVIPAFAFRDFSNVWGVKRSQREELQE